MSGAETAIGLALGVLPLLIAILENYEQTLVPFQTYRNFPRELREFKLKLQVQDDIFRNECVWLLSAIVERSEVEQVLGERSHGLRESVRNNPVMNQRFSEYLGRSLKSVVTVLGQMGAAFDELHAELTRLSLGISDKQKVDSIGSKPWRRRIAAQLKLSLKRKILYGKLDELHKLNTQLGTLSAQVMRLSNDEKQDLRMTAQLPDSRLEIFRVVHEASRRIYGALDNLWTCPEHRHSANLAIEPGIDRSETAAAINIRFEMAVNCWVIERSVWETPVIVDIESTVDRLQGANRVTQSETDTILADAVKALSTQADRRTQESTLVTDTTAPAGRFSSETGLLEAADLYCHASPCLRFQQLRQHPPPAERALVGILKGPVGCVAKHRIYLTPTANVSADNSMSLAEVISLASGGNYHAGLGISERVRLAKLLATSVLQFYSTPWLEDTWRSRDIYFFGIKDKVPQHSSLKSPYLSTYRNLPQRVETMPLSQRPGTSPSQPGVRNGALFGLGIMLLELGQKAPLQPDSSSVDQAAAEFIEAHRQSNMVQTYLGREYGIVVRKCLNCDFGLAVEEYDFGNMQLQSVFYRDVICKLEELERGCNMVGF